jgi:hypothetical protein
MCWIVLMQHYANGTQPEKSEPAMDRTMQLINKFPERLRFMVKTVNYIIKQEPEKALKVTEMWWFS